MAACGMACIQSIRAFTDPKDYELIVVETFDDKHGYPLWDGHKSLELDKSIHIQRTMDNDQGNSADMNEGASHATGDYLCFVENDVIFHPHWLENMLFYLENKIADVIIPCQYHATWEKMKEWEDIPHLRAYNRGLEEAGVLLMRKTDFDRIGGWDERMKRSMMWKAFLLRTQKAGLEVITTYKTWISHIGGVSYWWSVENDKENFDRQNLEECNYL